MRCVPAATCTCTTTTTTTTHHLLHPAPRLHLHHRPPHRARYPFLLLELELAEPLALPGGGAIPAGPLYMQVWAQSPLTSPWSRP